MNAATIVVLALAASGQPGAASQKEQAARAKSQQLLELHTADAASFAIYRDVLRKEKLELKRDPVYRWTNPTRVGGQVGEVFVWTYRGRPEVIGSIFSHPSGDGRRVMCHELHSLSLAVLVVDREAAEQWVPQAPGVHLQPVPDAPPPAGTPVQRLAQMRNLAREFSGRSLSDQGQAWELRLLPQPLYRDETTDDPDVVDAALFTMVSSAGTDPEIILLLEARKTPSGPRWFFGAARFSDMNLWLKHKDKEVWSSIRSDENTFYHDAKHRFRFYQDRFIPELGADSSKKRRSDGPHLALRRLAFAGEPGQQLGKGDKYNKTTITNSASTTCGDIIGLIPFFRRIKNTLHHLACPQAWALPKSASPPRVG